MSISTYAASLRALKAKAVHRLSEVGDQWQTPAALYWGVFAKFGPFVLDLFSDSDNAKCPRFYTAEDNALTQDWATDFAGNKGFANPPYSRSSYQDGQAITGMRNIITKATLERDKGAKFVFVIKAATSEVWWPEGADHVCFIRGRISFDLPRWFIPADKKQESSSAGFACAIAVFDKDWRGERMSYINRDDLLRDGQVMLEMIEAAANKAQEQAQFLQTECPTFMSEPLMTTNPVWPKEVQALVEQAFSANPNTYTAFRQQKLCEQVNQRLLDNVLKKDIITELNAMLARCEPVEEASCAA